MILAKMAELAINRQNRHTVNKNSNEMANEMAKGNGNLRNVHGNFLTKKSKIGILNFPGL